MSSDERSTGARPPEPGEATAGRVVRFPAGSASGLPGGARNVIDALTAHVALVDRVGTLFAVNAAWRRFAEANGWSLPGHGIGANYLSLLDGVQSAGIATPRAVEDGLIARQVARGLREVLAGERSLFQIEYPCHGRDEERWFLLSITPLEEGGVAGAVVAHENVTALKLAERRLGEHATRLASAFRSMVGAISIAIAKRDPYTADHQDQTSLLADQVALRLGLDADRRYGVRLGATIHDIGKIAAPTEILTRPGRLNEWEVGLIRRHCETGYDIVKGVDFPWPIADMVLQHHERVDGSGYPFGLSGEQLGIEVRILMVADVYDAITSHRPYRPALPREEAIAELRSPRYDPAVVDALVAYLSESPASR